MESVPVRLGHIKMNGEVRGTDAEMIQLRDSMRELGQLQDVVLTKDYEVIGGRRRIAIAKQLGWTHIRAFIAVKIDSAIRQLKAERDENSCRVETSRKEKLELARKLEALENPEAAARKAAAQAKKGQQIGAGNLPGPIAGKGRVRDKVAEVVGMGGQTLERAQAVVEAAQEAPERYLDLAERVQEDNQPVDPIHKEFRARKQIYEAADADPRFRDIADTLTHDHNTDAAFAAYESRRDEVSRDKVGQPIPKHLKKVFSATWIQECLSEIAEIRDRAFALENRVKKYAETVEHVSEFADVPNKLGLVHVYCKTAHDELQKVIPFAVCSVCAGQKCKSCSQSGWLTKQQYDELRGPT